MKGGDITERRTDTLSLRLVLACGDLKIEWETPESESLGFQTFAKNVLKESGNWLTSQNTPGQEAGFQLYLGCKKELNTIEVRNNLNYQKRSTKTFEVSASNSTNETFAQVILGEMEDPQNYDSDNFPILRFHFDNTLAQYVQFHILDDYGMKGGGLNYFNIYQDLNEYINQKSDFPSLSHDDTGFMCQDMTVGMKLEEHYSVHENVSSWRQCVEKCLEDEECQAWSWGRSLKCKLSNYEKRTEALTNTNQVSGLRQCKLFQQIFLITLFNLI